MRLSHSPHGVEGFATPKHLVKEDGTQAKLNEKLDFKVIEFNKDSKRVSSSATAASQKMPTSRNAARNLQHARLPRQLRLLQLPQSRKTTLGDLGALQALKEQMQQQEKKG